MQYDNLYDEFEDLDQGSLSPKVLSGHLPTNFNHSDEGGHGGYGVEGRRGQMNQLRSRPPINFAERYSAVGPSQMSGSTLRSDSNLGSLIGTRMAISSSRISSEDIISLNESEISLNPIYHTLRQNYDYVSRVLATYLERDLAEARLAKGGRVSSPLVMDIQQGMFCFVFKPWYLLTEFPHH
jgi:hypothetical protein